MSIITNEEACRIRLNAIATAERFKMAQCDRCGIWCLERDLLDLDTGSKCHPEPSDCAAAAKRVAEKPMHVN